MATVFRGDHVCNAKLFYKEDLQSLTLKALSPKAFCSVIAYSTAPTAVTAWLYEYDCTPLLFQVAISSIV